MGLEHVVVPVMITADGAAIINSAPIKVGGQEVDIHFGGIGNFMGAEISNDRHNWTPATAFTGAGGAAANVALVVAGSYVEIREKPEWLRIIVTAAAAAAQQAALVGIHKQVG